MALIGRIGAPRQRAAVPGRDEELDGAAQSVDGTGAAARRARKAGQVVAQCGISRLDGVRLALPGGDGVLARRVDQRFLGREGMRGVLASLRAPLEAVRPPRDGPLPDDVPAQDAACGALDLREDVGPGFLSAPKV